MIRVYTDIQEMTGQGEEWLLSNTEEVLFVFVDGCLVKSKDNLILEGDTK